MALKDMYFSISEAAKEFKVSRQTIYRWIEDKKILTEKVGGVILIDKAAIRKYATRKSFQSFAHGMDIYLVETLRKQCGYGSKDVIEDVDREKGSMSFIVTRKDGTSEKVNVGGIEITIATNKGDNGPTFKNMKLVDVAREEYKQPKDDGIIPKSKTRAKEAG